MTDRRRSTALLLLGAVILIALLFQPAPGGYFVADDHPVILRDSGAPLTTMLSWFTAPRYGWYRPLFDVFISFCHQVFGLNPLGYHLLSLGLFLLAAGLLGTVAWQVSADRRVAAVAGLLFLLGASHSEAVMWIAAANELLAGVWVLASIAAYIQLRRSGRLRWLMLAALACAAAFMSKETALFLPIMLAATDVLFYRRFTGKPLRPGALLPLVPFALIAAVIIVLRAPAVAYAVSYHPLQLAKNLVYYLLLEIVAFPVVATDLVAPAAYAPVALATLSLTVLAILVVIARRNRGLQQTAAHALAFAACLSVLALTPVIPIVSERTTFLSSAGIALALALLGFALWDRVSQRSAWFARIAAAASFVYLGANAFVLLDRNEDWRTAARENRSVIAQLGSRLPAVPQDGEVWLIGLPDQVGRAYAFRNVFPDGGILAGYGPAVHSVLDIELAGLSAAEQRGLYARTEARPGARLLWYRNGLLSPEPPQP